MFCNKERIKISSFFLFSSPKMGKTDCWLPTEALAGDVVGCPLSLPENVGTFFYFLYKKTKCFVQKIILSFRVPSAMIYYYLLFFAQSLGRIPYLC